MSIDKHHLQTPPVERIVAACDNVWEALAVGVLVRSVLDAHAGDRDARAFVESDSFADWCETLEFDAARWRRAI